MFNGAGLTLNINGSNILIKNNTISEYENGNYYVTYNAGTMNINLYGDNPTFEMSENKTAEKNELTADIYLDNRSSKLNFINNSNDKAIIRLENGIGGKGFITFKNGNGHNGSFEVKSKRIEANNYK